MVVGERPFVCLIYLASLVLVWQPSSPPGGGGVQDSQELLCGIKPVMRDNDVCQGGVTYVTGTFVLDFSNPKRT